MMFRRKTAIRPDTLLVPVSRPQPETGSVRAVMKQRILRVLIATSLVLGAYYLSWRYLHSINWSAWWIALPLVAAETYSYIDAWLFGLGIWRIRERQKPPPPPEGATVDVFITCYNEPVELVRGTVRAAAAIRYPHATYVLDDGNSDEMRAMTEVEGVGYLVRSADWKGRERHAKAGNLNSALFQTSGEFILILDADQQPLPPVLDHTLGYFRDPGVAFVQTPQWFYNVPRGDPYGSQAPLFYGPIQKGKDGWNAAFFCGSNAVLRREALMQLGVTRYSTELERRVRRALKAADTILSSASRKTRDHHAGRGESMTVQALHATRLAVKSAMTRLSARAPLQEVTWAFQREVEEISRRLVNEDLAQIRAELRQIPGVSMEHFSDDLSDLLDDEEALAVLTSREASPLAAIETVRALLLSVDVDRGDEAQPVMPMSTISVTEDMATAMRLHALGWQSVYHHEILVRGLAPEDLRTALQQRLRWAQGTMQVMFRENPLLVPGLTVGQRIMYAGTMWSYLSGFFALAYFMAPMLYLVAGVLPVRALSGNFFWHLLPFLLLNQCVFLVVGWGLPTWRGQQYSLALFPLWIKAVTSVVQNVFFHRKLGFVVTPKTRQSGIYLGLVRPQLAVMGMLVIAIAIGLGRLAAGATRDGLPVVVNVFWACYDLAMLSVVLDAAFYQPAEGAAEHTPPTMTASTEHGRVGAGRGR
jgi:cellulose synthase (UDP-forming)